MNDNGMRVETTGDGPTLLPLVTPLPQGGPNENGVAPFASPKNTKSPRPPAPPTPLPAAKHTEKRIDYDLILDQEFYTGASETAQKEIIRCLYFLYGRNFYWRKYRHNEDATSPLSLVDKNRRVGIIKEMVENVEFRRRLLQVLECFGDKDMTKHDESGGIRSKFTLFAQSFLRLLNHVVGKDEVFFKEDMTNLILFLRYQTFGICYHVAACTAYGYQVQRDQPHRFIGTPDASQLAHRTMNDLELYNLVLEKEGGTAVGSMGTLIGKTLKDFLLIPFWDSRHSLKSFEVDARECLKRYGVGLVDSFCIHGNFNRLHFEEEEKWKRGESRCPGVWVFDGDENAKGSFLHLDQEVHNESDRICKMWKDRDNNKRATKPFLAPNAPFVLRSSETTNRPDVDHTAPLPSDHTEPAQDAPPPPPPPPRQQIDRHTMIILLSYKDGDKTFFLLQNSWQYLPLVLVTGQYLVACEATVSFNPTKLGDERTGLRTDLSVTSCCLPKSAGVQVPCIQEPPKPGF